MKEKALPNKYMVDFDLTLSQTRFNKTTGGYDMGKALPGIVEAVNECAKTNEIVIFTSRPFAEWEEMRAWLKAHNVQYNGIQSKPLAIAYVDDRAMKPDEFIERFKPPKPRKPIDVDEYYRGEQETDIYRDDIYSDERD